MIPIITDRTKERTTRDIVSEDWNIIILTINKTPIPRPAIEVNCIPFIPEAAISHQITEKYINSKLITLNSTIKTQSTQ